MSNFQEHYSDLHNEELISIALTRGRDLVPEARAALEAELLKRGLNDLSSHRAVLESEASAEEEQRQALLSHREKVVRWRTNAIYALAVFACGYGAYRLAYPNKENPGDDGGLMFVFGVAIFLFGALTSFLSKLWGKHVLHRPSP